MSNEKNFKLKELSLYLFGLAIFLVLFYGYGYKDANLLVFGLAFLYTYTLIFLNTSSNFSYKLMILVVFLEAMLLGSLGLEWGHHISPSDTSFWIQNTEIIKEKGHWQIGIGTFRSSSYSQYPILGIFGSIVSMVLSLDLVMCSKLFLVIIPVLILLFFVLFIKELTKSEEIAILSGLIYVSNPRITIFTILEPYHYENLAIVYIMIVLYLMQMEFSENRHLSMVPLGILIPLIAMTHHWASYNLLLLISTFYIFPALYSYLIRILHIREAINLTIVQLRKAFYVFIYAILSVVLYGIYVSAIFYLQIKFFIRESINTMVLTPSYNPWDYSNLELIITIFGHLILVIFGFLGIIKSFRSYKFSNRIIECSFLISGLYFFIFFFLFSKLSFTITLRAYAYFFAMASPMVALGMLSANKKLKVIKVALAFFILLSSYSITGIFHKLEYPTYSQTNIMYSALNTIKLSEGTVIMFSPPPLFEMLVAIKRLDIPPPTIVTPTLIYEHIDSYNLSTLMKTYKVKYFFFYTGWDPLKIDRFFIKPYYNSTFIELFYKINNDSSLNLIYNNNIFTMFSINS